MRYSFLLLVLFFILPLAAQDITYRGGDGHGGSNALYSGSVTLPLTIVDFTATPSDERVILNWTTQEEVDTDYFTLLRSADGITYRPLHRQAAAGQAGGQELHYSFTDPHPLAGAAYYRLRVTDYDGSLTFSKVVTVASHQRTAAFTLYPNPSQGSAVYTEASETTAGSTLTIYRTDGQKHSVTQVPTRGPALLPRLATGVYVVRLNRPDGSQQTQLLTITEGN